ncbi:MAG TPA: M4 family metallopeptidase, partial [Kofleriaceae bacterium]
GPDAPEVDQETPTSPDDVNDALKGLPDAQVLQFTNDGLAVYMVGDLGHAPTAAIPEDLQSAHAMIADTLTPVLKAYRLANTDLVPTKMHADEMGNHHIRYQQVHEGLPVIGGDLVVGVDTKGAIFSVNGTARGDQFTGLGAHAVSDAQALSTISHDSRFTGLTTGATRPVYIALADDGSMHKALEATVSGSRGLDPVRDLVYIDVDTGNIIADYPQIHFAESRRVYTAKNTTNVPGTLVITEGQSSTDLDVQGAYNGTGAAYEMYHTVLGRDSYDNAGAVLTSTVHYDQNYCNAYWDGESQMVYGDGDPSQGCSNLARAVDVTAHELTHAVTQFESNLTYSGESGGMNESNSDIFGSITEAWVDGGKSGTNFQISDSTTWIIGEEVLPPGLRWMNDPLKDGTSPNFYSSTLGNLDVHYSSGIGNLAFYLATAGGKNPRTKTGVTQVTVTGIGMEKAAKIWYKANTDILTSSSKYANWRLATEQAATQLGYDDSVRNAISCAWNDVGVTGGQTCNGAGGGGSGSGSGSGSGGGSGSGSGSGGGSGSGSGSGSGGGNTGGVLTSGVSQSVPAGAKASATYYTLVVPAGSTSVTFALSGGTGDADLYVQNGSKPTTSTYACRSWNDATNGENCAFSSPAAGTYYVMVYGYAAYSGASIVGTVTGSGGGGGGGGSVLQNGVPVTGVSGAKNSQQTWSFQHTGTATIKITGSTSSSSDADLYVKNTSAPTTTSYSCRPYVTGSNETCTAAAGTTYVMLRGYSAYSGVTLVANW